MADKSLKDILAHATSTQDEILKVLREIRIVDRQAFRDIVDVAMNPGATFTRDKTIDMLGGHTVLGQTMFDIGTKGLREGHQDLIVGLLEKGADGWDLAEFVTDKEPETRHDLDAEPA